MKSVLALVALLALVSAVPARADFQILEFSAGLLEVTPESGGNGWTGQLAWNPTIGLGGVDLRGDLGLAFPAPFGSHITVWDYQLLLRLPLIPLFSIEGGGGWQTWINSGGTHGIVSMNLNFDLPFKIIVIDRFYAGYSRFFLPNDGVNEYRLGIGIAL